MQAGQTKYGIGMTLSACLWLGLFPLLQTGSFSTMTRDKWIFMLILTGISLLGFLADGCFRRLSRPSLLSLLCGGGLLLWLALSTLFSPYPVESWWIGAGRREGLASQLCYLSLFLMFSCARVRKEPVLYSAAGGVALFFTVVLLQRIGLNPLGLYPAKYSYAVEPMFQGTIGHVDMCAGYLLIVCGLFLPALAETAGRFFRARQSKCLFAVLLAAFALTVYLLVTIRVDLALLTLAVLVVWTLVRLLPVRFRFPCLLLLLVLFLLFVWFFSASSGPLWELHEILHGRPQVTFGSGRIGVWSYSLRMLREDGRWFLGSGPDTFVLRFNAFLKNYFLVHPEAPRLAEYFDSPHCEYLALVINGGIPAFLFFAVLVLAGCFGTAAWRDGVLCYGVQALLSFSVCIVAPMFWVVLGLSLVRFRKEKNASPDLLALREENPPSV